MPRDAAIILNSKITSLFSRTLIILSRKCNISVSNATFSVSNGAPAPRRRDVHETLATVSPRADRHRSLSETMKFVLKMMNLLLLKPEVS